MELSWMPGPTDEARALQLKQTQLADVLYATLSKLLENQGEASDEAVFSKPAYLTAKAGYEASVAELQDLLGVDAGCGYVDSDLWGAYSDCYKSENGIRPRFHVTRAEAAAFMDSSTSMHFLAEQDRPTT